MTTARRQAGSKAWVRRGLWLWFACTGLVGAAAEPPHDEAARIARERAEIRAERDRLDARFATETARCAERFAVTACVDDVRERRHAAQEGLRARALALDDAERLRRAAARREALAQKQQGIVERPLAAAPDASASVAASPPPERGQSRVLPQAPAAAGSSVAEAAAAQRAAAARRRQAEIQAKQARVEARQAERARQGKAAAPLPVPAASRAGAP